MDRVLSLKQEEALILCHHDHMGLSIEAAADTMGVTVKQVKRLLSQAKRAAPQMFPILTPQHRAILMMYDQHMSRKTIAAGLDITMNVLARQVEFLRRHGFLFNRTMKQYRPSMDGQVKERF